MQFRFMHRVTNLVVADGLLPHRNAAAGRPEGPPLRARPRRRPGPAARPRPRKAPPKGPRPRARRRAEGVAPIALEYGAEEDGFDECRPRHLGRRARDVCGELAEHDERFREMLPQHPLGGHTGAAGLADEAASRDGLEALGGRGLSAYYEPMATFAAMGHLCSSREVAPRRRRAADIVYFCGPLPTAAERGDR